MIILLPVTGLFVQSWRATDEKISFGVHEQEGVEYLSALGPLTVALVQTQSAGVNETTADTAALARAVENVAAVDDRLGASLLLHERWTDVRAKIEALAHRTQDAEATYASYREVTDLVLALYGKVRQNSNLIRDPDADSYYLQDAAAEELPEATVAAGRYGDLAFLASRRPGSQQIQTLAQLIGAKSDVTSPAEDTAEDVSAAAAAVSSRTLSNNVLSQLDRVRFTTDAIGDFDGLFDGSFTSADLTATAKLQGDAVAAASTLSTTVLTEIEGIVAERLDNLRWQRTLALVAFGLAIVIALVPAALTLIALRRTGRREQPPGRHGHVANEAVPDAGPNSPARPWSTEVPASGFRQRERERSGVPR